jgi:hypothetical protein
VASGGKRKTTMAKLNRERKLVERRQEKKARKDARKRAPAYDPDAPSDLVTETTGETAGPSRVAIDTVGAVRQDHLEAPATDAP